MFKLSDKARNTLSVIMKNAWLLVKTTGITISEALKKAWSLAKLKKQMLAGIVKFHFVKINGEIREAFGTLRADLISYETKGNSRKPNDTLFTYFDTEKQEYRSFKKWNLCTIL